MQTPEHLKTLVLTLDTSAAPMAGRLDDSAGGSREFVGWLGLAAALEALLQPDVATPPPSPSRR